MVYRSIPFLSNVVRHLLIFSQNTHFFSIIIKRKSRNETFQLIKLQFQMICFEQYTCTVWHNVHLLHLSNTEEDSQQLKPEPCAYCHCTNIGKPFKRQIQKCSQDWAYPQTCALAGLHVSL